MSNKFVARILIADDQEATRRALKSLVESCPGCGVCAEAVDGYEAIQKAAETQPDLIVLDLSMPVTNGLEAARIISRAMPKVPILIYTLHVTPELAIAAKTAGVRQIIDKAGTREKLLTAITFLLSSSGSRLVERDAASQASSAIG